MQYQVLAKATTILGSHQLRYGFLYEQIEYDNINQRTGPTFLAPNGQQTATGARDHRSPPGRSPGSDKSTA